MSDVFDAWRERHLRRLRRLIDRGLGAQAAIAVKRRRRPRLGPRAPPRWRPTLSMRWPTFIAREPVRAAPVEFSLRNCDATPPEWRLNPEAYVE
jgi:hypothetical protein